MTDAWTKAVEAATRAIFEASVYRGYNDETLKNEWIRTQRLHRHNAEAAIRAYLAAMEAEGFVLVPKEPTEEMIAAGMAEEGVDLASEYRAAVAAAGAVLRRR